MIARGIIANIDDVVASLVNVRIAMRTQAMNAAPKLGTMRVYRLRKPSPWSLSTTETAICLKDASVAAWKNVNASIASA